MHRLFPVRNLLAWNGFSVTIPNDWEVTAYHLDPDKGEFRCNRRLEPRLQLTWRRYPKAEPDVTRVLRDLQVRMCEQRLFGPEEPAMPERSGWTIARGRSQVPRRAARWDARNRLLVHVVLDPETTEAKLLRLRSQRIWELAELDLLHGWCDGKTTVGQMVERIHRDEHLPWNEARQVVLSYLPRLVSRGIIVVGKPA